MKLILQPGDGPALILKGINQAKTSIEILIFRFDRNEIERALANAVKRGVFVHALVAHANRAGEDGLRDLEMRLLAAGVNVARTSDDLVRYHGKMMIVDRRELYLFAFNLTYLDIERSRSFGLLTTNPKLVHQAIRLFEADTKRLPVEAGYSKFIVSPVNARKELTAFIKGAKKELLIYDPMVSDAAMIRLLEERSASGVQVKILGKIGERRSSLDVHKLQKLRLHARAMIRDRKDAFIGSQSLRETELDSRREVGVIFQDQRVVHRLAAVFQQDREQAERVQNKAEEDDQGQAAKAAKKVAKAVTRDLQPVAPAIQEVIQEIAGDPSHLDLDPKEVEESVKAAVKEAVKEVVRDVVEEVVGQREEMGWMRIPTPEESKMPAPANGRSK
jgi:phosphatidylserine/phosphatidylglycerophosphate/cardiolipin synthase-like enzyme